MYDARRRSKVMTDSLADISPFPCEKERNGSLMKVTPALSMKTDDAFHSLVQT